MISKIAPEEKKKPDVLTGTGSSAWMATSPQDRKAYLNQRISEIETELGSKDWTSKDVYRRGELEKTLTALKAEQKSLSGSDSGFKFLSSPSTL